MSKILSLRTTVRRRLSRRKEMDERDGPKLARVLNLFDLTALGVGSTLGLGVYVLAGSVAYNIAGPAVTLSFLIAAIASLFAGLCYAEFASRVPQAGSAYIYSFVTMGEFVAFTIGWNLVLEYVVGTASVARGFTSYVDALVNKTLSGNLKNIFPLELNYLSDYLDVVSFAMIVLLTIVLSIGVKESTILNNVLTMLNILTIITVVFAGCTRCNLENWQRSADDVPQDKLGVGGFMPYGVHGVVVGAAKCFYGFIGFDCIATTGEEAIRPKRDIPIAILLSLAIIVISYVSMASVLTLMMPYYDIDPLAPLSYAFAYADMNLIKWCVSLGALCALCTSLLGAMFPLPRILYAMSLDGLMFERFGRIHHWTHTPLLATICSGVLAATIAMLLDLEQLIELGSIGTLLAYSIVAIGVLILHYQDDGNTLGPERITCCMLLRQLYNGPRYGESNDFTECFSKFLVCIFLLLCLTISGLAQFLNLKDRISWIPMGVVILLMLLCMIVMFMQPKSQVSADFVVPCVPFIPCATIFINTYLMFQFMLFTWIGFLVWVLIGYLFYFAYMLINFIVIVPICLPNKTWCYLSRFMEPG